MMGLGQCCDLRQVQVQICSICKRDMNEHQQGCPLAIAKLLQKQNIHAYCPACTNDNGIGVNHEDWYECRVCHTQFVSGHAIPEDVSKLEWSDLFIKAWVPSANPKIGFALHEEVVSTVRLTEKGKCIFPIDQALDFCDFVAKLARGKIGRKKKIELDLSALWMEAFELKHAQAPLQQQTDQKITEILKSAQEI